MNGEGKEFLNALTGRALADERFIVCAFVGDPNTAGFHAWRPRPLRPRGEPPDLRKEANAYVTVASFGRSGDGSFRRRAENFSAGWALMVDDVGTKVDPAKVDFVAPSAKIETSRGNYQYWYMLDEGERDFGRFDGAIRAFIADRLAAADPGMAGVNRVGRIPGFTNGKPAAEGWRVAMRELVDLRYPLGELLDRFRLSIRGRREPRRERLTTEDAFARNERFEVVLEWLRRRRMIRRGDFDPSGWLEIECPWIDEHTARAATGAAIREPHEDNGWTGAFKCNHGHCADRGWAELSDWIAEVAGEELLAANDVDGGE